MPISRALRLLILGLVALAVARIVRRSRRAADHGAGISEIAPGVLHIGLGGRSQTNAYLIAGDHGWGLVDAGWASDAARIETAIRLSRLVPPEPDVRPAAILLTHVHPDHSGAARALADAWACPILVHPAEVPIAQGDFAAMQRGAGPLDRWLILPLMRAMGARRRTAILAAGRLGSRVRELPADGTIPGFPEWAWLPTPGHTAGHVSFIRRRDGVVLTGDALLTLRVNDLAGMVSGAEGASEPPWYTTWDADLARASIAAIVAAEPAIVGPGHGRPWTGSDLAGLLPHARRLAATGGSSGLAGQVRLPGRAAR